MKYETIEILDELKQVYNECLNSELISVKIVQSNNDVLLITQFNDDEVFIENLEVVSDDDFIELSDIINPALFNTTYTINENAEKFIKELNLETLRQCFDRLIIE